MDRCIRPFSYGLLGITFFFEIWLFFFAADPYQHKYLLPGTVFLSALTATCGWMWSGHINRRLHRRHQAVTLLLAARSKEVNEWKETVYAYIANPAGGVPGSAIQKLLGLYEFMSICIMNGTVDEPMVEQSQRLVYRRIYEGLKPHIETAVQTHTDNYCHFIFYTKKWNPDMFAIPTVAPHFVAPDTEF